MSSSKELHEFVYKLKKLLEQYEKMEKTLHYAESHINTVVRAGRAFDAIDIRCMRMDGLNITQIRKEKV